MSNQNETPNEETLAHTEQEDDAVQRTVSTLFKLGRVWASYGLGVGHAALETSATTLRTTAGLLGDLSERISTEEDVEDERAA